MHARRFPAGARISWRAAGRLAGAMLAVWVLIQLAISLVWRLTHPVVATIDRVDDDTSVDRGAVRSVQTADLTMPEERLDAIWTPEHLERLARTYWRFLSRVTLGFIRVSYTEGERFVVFIARPLVLLRFQAPEYEMDARRGIVRWRIERGLLVSRRGRGGDGYLEIDVTRRPSPEPGHAVAHVEVEVANFYPAIASGLSTFVYTATQSRIHVLVTHAFLRSLSRLDFSISRVGRFAERTVEELPDPTRPERRPSPASPRSSPASSPGRAGR